MLKIIFSFLYSRDDCGSYLSFQTSDSVTTTKNQIDIFSNEFYSNDYGSWIFNFFIFFIASFCLIWFAHKTIFVRLLVMAFQFEIFWNIFLIQKYHKSKTNAIQFQSTKWLFSTVCNKTQQKLKQNRELTQYYDS